MKIKPVIQLFRDFAFGDPIKTQKDRIEEAAKAHAKNVGEAEFERTMANFYTDRVMQINPHQDWWGFAKEKQKQYDHQTDCTIYEQRAAEAKAQIAAHTAKLGKLLEKHS